MTILVLFILAVIWAAVLLPPYLQNRSESRPADSISSFQRQLSVLERRSHLSNPDAARRYRPAVTGVTSTPAMAPYGRVRPGPSGDIFRLNRSEAKRRRRDVLATLAAAAGITFLLALTLGGVAWGLHLLCDLMLGAYVVLLAQSQNRAAERASKVRYLPARNNRHEPALLFRRANG